MMPASVRLTSVVGAGAWQHPLRGALCSPQQRRLGVVSLAHWSPSCTLVGAIRCVSSSSASSLHVKSRFPQQRRVRGKRITLGAAAVTLVGLGLAASTIYAASADERRPLAEATWPELLRRYFVYSCCSSSTLVDWSPVMIDWCRSTRIPGVRPVFEWCMTHTFFAQVGTSGGLAPACFPYNGPCTYDSLHRATPCSLSEVRRSRSACKP